MVQILEKSCGKVISFLYCFYPFFLMKSVIDRWHFHVGCHAPLGLWLSSCADALFVIGFCVIAFLKFTFLGLLRFEIKEMIQKIKVLQVKLFPPFQEDK